MNYELGNLIVAACVLLGWAAHAGVMWAGLRAVRDALTVHAAEDWRRFDRMDDRLDLIDQRLERVDDRQRLGTRTGGSGQ